MYLSPSYRLTQFFILHRAYRTPKFLFNMGLRADSKCSRCGNSGSLIHLLWRCPNFQRYWAQVVGTLNGILDMDLSVDPLTCLLGYIDNSVLKPPKWITVCCLWLGDKLSLSGSPRDLRLYPTGYSILISVFYMRNIFPF